MAYAAYHLAKNPEIQKRLQEEVDLAYDESNGEELSYAVVQVNLLFGIFADWIFNIDVNKNNLD
jgi:hypothetical protein